MKHIEVMKTLQKSLQKKGYIVYRPHTFEEQGIKGPTPEEERAEHKIEHDLIREHYKKILRSDGIIVVNEEKNGIAGYVGGNTLMEMGFAHVHNRDIFITQPSPKISYQSEINAMQPMLIDNPNVLDSYYESLPKTYVSSESPIKLTAVMYGLRELGFITTVEGYKTKSGVVEQPMSIEEAYNGAKNRLADLKNQVKHKPYAFLASLESGLIKLHKDHDFFGFTVGIVETATGEVHTGITSDMEIPGELTDQVPEPYADLGILVQKKFGSKLKDPYTYITDNKIDRLQVLVYTVKMAVGKIISLK